MVVVRESGVLGGVSGAMWSRNNVLSLISKRGGAMNRELRHWVGGIAICMSLSACAAPASTVQPSAAANTDSTSLATSTEPLVPFGFQLGKTTLEMAAQQWKNAGAKITGQGYAAIGAGSGMDDSAKLSAKKIILIDVADTPFEVTRTARFTFYDGVLYSVQTVLHESSIWRKQPANQLDGKAVDELEATLRQKYGPPTYAGRDMFAGKTPNMLVWEFGPNHLVLYKGGLRESFLGFTNQPLRIEAERYAKSECAKYVACSGYKKK